MDFTSNEWERHVKEKDKSTSYGGRFFVCRQCNERKAGFWANEYEMPCDDCSILNRIKTSEEAVIEAYRSGKYKYEDFNKTGKRMIDQRKAEEQPEAY